MAGRWSTSTFRQWLGLDVAYTTSSIWTSSISVLRWPSQLTTTTNPSRWWAPPRLMRWPVLDFSILDDVEKKKERKEVLSSLEEVSTMFLVVCCRRMTSSGEEFGGRVNNSVVVGLAKHKLTQRQTPSCGLMRWPELDFSILDDVEKKKERKEVLSSLEEVSTMFLVVCCRRMTSSGEEFGGRVNNSVVVGLAKHGGGHVSGLRMMLLKNEELNFLVPELEPVLITIFYKGNLFYSSRPQQSCLKKDPNHLNVEAYIFDRVFMSLSTSIYSHAH
ncbi:hypothetical protein NC651_012287 [Populus alba x Populus x berolinensis]|nr:hypothetical protein NC651_012287 [Populus alba x Populus x berolinensis]